MAAALRSQDQVEQDRSRRVLAELAVVLAATAIGQAIVLVGHAGVVRQPDSASYVHYAHQLRHLRFTDTFRTPGYPAVLAVFGTTGTVALQIALVSVVPLMVWAIARRAFGSGFAATAAGVVAALDVYATQWERVVGTESLACVSILAWAALLLAVLRTRRWTLAAGLAAAWLIILRPIFLPLVVVAVAIVSLRIGWRRAAIIGGCALLPVAALSVANGLTHRTWTMTTVASDAVIGKVFRYDMQRHQAPPRFAAVEAGVRRMKWDGTVGSFSRAAPEVSLGTLRSWAKYVATHHPVEYTRKSLRDLVDIWFLRPGHYTSWADTPLSALGLVAVALAYAIAPIGLAVAALRRDVFLGALSACVIALLLILAFDEYIDFDRVRMPVDAIALVALAGSAVWLDRIRREAS